MQSAYTGEHDEYRRALRRFLDAELEPHIEKFVTAGGHDTSFWKKAGAAGMLGVTIPEEYGGPGGDKLFNRAMRSAAAWAARASALRLRAISRRPCWWTTVLMNRSCAGVAASCPETRFRHSP